MAHKRKFALALRKVMALLLVGAISMMSMAPGVAVAQAPAPAPDGGQVAAPASQTATLTFLPLTIKNRCAEALNYAKNHFGVQAYGYLGPVSPYYCALVDSGATWVRNEIAWESIEPQDVSPVGYNWTAADSAIDTARSGGYNLIITVNRNPAWASSFLQGPIDKVPLTQFTTFVSALVERYDGDGVNDAPGSPKVEYWEFYNEPDAGFLHNDHRWGHYGQEYAQMLAAVYPAVKAANPNAKVLIGGIAYDWFEDQNGPFVREFIDDVLENGGGQYFDIMNFHQYPPFAANWGSANGPGLVEKTQAVRAKLAEYGLEKPIMITESGMHSNNAATSPMTPELQARYVTMIFAQTFAANVETLIWFMLYDPGEVYPYRNGLVTSATANTQSERKPSFTAYQTTVAMLEGATFQQALTAAETGNADLIAYRFRDKNGQTLYVTWLGPITRTDTANLSLPGTVATVYDIYGVYKHTVADADDGQSDGRITLAVGAQPAYVRIQQ
jgi:GH35 family endo-1,4-beta-xylanase